MTDQSPASQTSGKAAELMAAVRAVESGERSAAEFFAAPPPVSPAAAGGRPAPSSPARTAVDTPAVPAGAPPSGAAAASSGLAELLAAGGAPPALADRVAAALGPDADATLRADPWALLLVPGVSPEQADEFARALLGADCSPGDDRRVAALAAWLLESAARHGHTACGVDELARRLAQYAVPDPDSALRSAAELGGVLLFHDPVPGAEPDAEGQVPVVELAGLERYALAEESLADGVRRLLAARLAPAGAPTDPGSVAGRTEAVVGPTEAVMGDGETVGGGAAGGRFSDWEDAADRVGSGSAAELIRATARSGVVVHCGGAAARQEAAELLARARDMGLRVRCAVHAVEESSATPGDTATDAARPGDSGTAADGPGAANEAGSADRPVTVAHLLARAPRDDDGALAVDLLVVLDAAQLTTETAAALVEALPDGSRLVLSGDRGLLGPAGAGRPFAGLASSGELPVVLSRTPEPGPVGELVSHVAVGELPQVPAANHEVVVVPVRDAGEASHRTVQLVAESIPRAFGHQGADIGVITPAHGGAVGTRALNAALKARLNPGPGASAGFDPGDRVAWSPVPGETRLGWFLGEAPGGSRQLLIECGGEQFSVEPSGALRHGWALTAHQALGRQWPAAVVVVPGDAGTRLDRAWVYSAFSRAREHLSVVQGAGPQLTQAVGVTAPQPVTRLATLLSEANRTAGGS